MKKIVSILLLFAVAMTLVSCDLSKVGTTNTPDMPDLVAKAAGETELIVYDRETPFSFKVEVDKDTVVGDDVRYQWKAYAFNENASGSATMDGKKGEWADLVFYEGDTYNDPVFSSYWAAMIVEGTEKAGILKAMEMDSWCKITCSVYNPEPEISEDVSRDRNEEIDFFVYLSGEGDPAQNGSIFTVTGEDTVRGVSEKDGEITVPGMVKLSASSTNAHGTVTYKWYMTTEADAERNSRFYFNVYLIGEGSEIEVQSPLSTDDYVLCVAFDGRFYAYKYFKILAANG